MARPVFALRVRAEPDTRDEIRRLRAWLKRGLRDFGLRCLDICEERGRRREVMAKINLNNTPTQRDRETVPAGIYGLKAEVVPGGVGDGGILRRAKNGYGLMLELKCSVAAGEHKGHCIWDYPTVELDEKAPPPVDDKGRANLQAAQAALHIGPIRVRAIIDSALGLDPNDRSPEMEEKRSFDGWGEIDGLTFWAQVGERPAQGQYGPSNVIDFVIVPGDPDYPKTVQAVVPRKSLRDEMDDVIPFLGKE
jgi:hypothetical protein